MKKVWVLIPLVLLCIFASDVKGQRQYPKNRANWDQQPWHFGMTLGVNFANSHIRKEAQFFPPDSILGIEPNSAPGFHLGPIAHLHLNKNIGLRFTPNFSFQDRVILYTIKDSKRRTGVSLVEKRIESSNFDFPLNFKFRTDRVNNFAAFALLGGKYTIDLQSQEKVDQSLGPNAILKTRKIDYALEVGAGCDFFFRYFKLGVEAKKALGLRNALVRDFSKFDTPLTGLWTRLFMLSITIEG